jgi:SAM-dependent methyltransferase
MSEQSNRPAAYDATLFRAVHAGNPGDVSFYARACEGASSVLELGCGWGRVLRALRSPRRTLVGIDTDERFVSMARVEVPGAELLWADMASFELGARRFDRILVPHSGLWCLPDETTLAACLRSARAHLGAGGQLVFDAWNADGFHAESVPEDRSDDHLDFVVTVGIDDAMWDVYERSEWDRSAQRLEVTYVYQSHDGEPTREGTLVHHYRRRAEIERALEAAGLAAVAVYGGFDNEPWTPDADHLVVVAEAC